MNAHHPDLLTFRAALELATRAPSVHNVQPWKWRVGARSLHLFSDDALQLVHTDPDGRDAMVSCGATLNHCVVALAALGWQSRIHRFPNPAQPTHLASIEVLPYAASEVDVALAAAIPRRRTDRRYLSGWPVSHGDVALMGMRAARMGIAMRRVEPSTEVRETLARAVGRHAADPDYLRELTIWSGRHSSTAGVPARNAPESSPNCPVPGRLFASTALAQPPEAVPAEDRGVLLALGTAEDDDLARLRAGEATSLVLLTATSLGMASCPVTEVLEFSDTRDAIRVDAFGGDEFPQMLVRIGWAPINADPLPSTPRRPLSEVVTQLDDSPWD
ncbi:MAG: nitroreductase family protein [Mycobacterium sp.]